jgi:hypothetical protein
LATDTALAMRGTQQILCLSVILNFLLNFLLVVSCLHCPAGIGISQGPTGCFRALCDQLDNLAFPRLQGSNMPKYVHCSNEFNTCHAMDSHRQKQSSLGTGRADPSNSKSVSFTGRPSFSSSIVREHDFLGAHPNHTEAVYVHRQLLPSTRQKHSIIDIMCIIAIISIILI